jgi:hypothetical protein
MYDSVNNNNFNPSQSVLFVVEANDAYAIDPPPPSPKQNNLNAEQCKMKSNKRKKDSNAPKRPKQARFHYMALIEYE